jgi:hypothetical protein
MYCKVPSLILQGIFEGHRPEFSVGYGMEVVEKLPSFCRQKVSYWYSFCLTIIKLLDNLSNFHYGEKLNAKK